VALAVHRLGNWRMGVRSPVLRAPLTAAYRVAYHSVIAALGIDLPYNVKLGRRVRFDHHGCIVMGAWSVGDDVIVRGPATIGLARPDGRRAPIIGNRVEIGPRACVGGGIRVGDDAFVGPATVLTEDLPAGATALGNPCRQVDLDKLLAPAVRAPSRPPKARA
jgi:serine O-acetyltransferase